MPESNVRTPAAAKELIAHADAARRAHPLSVHTDAWRVLNGPGDDGPPGLTIDRYADWLVVTARVEVPSPTVELWCAGAREVPGVRGVILKSLARPVSASASRLWGGESPPRPLPVREDDVVMLCELDDGISTGLFLDQREVRREVRAFARDTDVLNLFAYTGAFSVHAAKAGARRVTSVDAARRALARGRDNMRASGIDPDAHRWFPDDVHTHLARAARRGDRYGLVVLDPPMFGRAGAKVHTLDQQLAPLVEHAASVVAPGGVLVLSTHALEIEPSMLLELVRMAGGRRRMQVLGQRGLPEWDHPTVRGPGTEADRGRYLKTVLVRLD